MHIEDDIKENNMQGPKLLFDLAEISVSGFFLGYLFHVGMDLVDVGGIYMYFVPSKPHAQVDANFSNLSQITLAFFFCHALVPTS